MNNSRAPWNRACRCHGGFNRWFGLQSKTKDAIVVAANTAVIRAFPIVTRSICLKTERTAANYTGSKQLRGALRRNLQHRRFLPQPLQVVILPSLLREDVDDEIAVVAQDPLRGFVPFHVRR